MIEIDPRAGADPVWIIVAVAVALAAVAFVGLLVLVGEGAHPGRLGRIGERVGEGLTFKLNVNNLVNARR